MVAGKTVSPMKTKSPKKSNQKYFEQRFNKEQTNGVYRKRQNVVEPEKTSKTALIGMGLFFLMFLSSTIYSFAKSKGIDSKQANSRPQVAGLDIPREIMERIQRLTNTQDREAVIMEWAESVGITFENKKDGSYVAYREGEEYVIREADPDYVEEEFEEVEQIEQINDDFNEIEHEIIE